ncbi:hypothetical protein KQI36_14350 [Clostridium senegalense]|uniref:hypothetical protein n=1 Tax=Clostridium senegalense TaxID=1465809 RepID=UPI001C118834|nr:hypothetical protein [Clostridium senegalense]MBU5227814.1 hypothetical protein [Clostridium senegalense]
MENLKVSVTKVKREETIDKILNLIANEFDGVEITAIFTKMLLEDAIKTVEYKSLNANLKDLI